MKTKILILVLAVFAFGACVVDDVESIETIKESVVDDALKGASHDDDEIEDDSLPVIHYAFYDVIFFENMMIDKSEIQFTRNEYFNRFSSLSLTNQYDNDPYHEVWMSSFYVGPGGVVINPEDDLPGASSNDSRVRITLIE